MAHDHDEIIRTGTQRVAGREALRRLSRMVQDWQTEEREKYDLAKRVVIILAVFSAALFATFILTII